MRRAGLVLLGLVVAIAVFAPALSPNDPAATYRDRPFAPPSRIRMVDPAGSLVSPFTYATRLVSRLERRYEEDRGTALPLRWFHNGRLVTVTGPSPLLLLGADSSGRDLLARLLYGARVSLALAAIATLGAMLLGLAIGGVAGYAGGMTDEVLSRISDFVLVLPSVYVVLALRAVMPLVLPDGTVFLLMTGIFALIGWPFVARGVRAIIASEWRSEHAQAARALGAGHVRLLAHHLLPATSGFLAVQATLLLPGFVLAEATMSYVGLGFSDRTPSWGTMLHDASNVTLLADVPWALAPAAAIFVVVLGVNLVVSGASPLDVARGGQIPVDRSPSSGTISR